MADTIATKGFAFFQGTDRVVEERLFTGYFAQVFATPQKVAGQKAQFTQMVMYGSAENVLATGVTLRGIENVTHALPYTLQIPPDRIKVPNGTLPIADCDTFFSTVLKDYYGLNVVKTADAAKNALWVIVDPHLMAATTRAQIAVQLRNYKALIILPVGVKIPPELIALATTGQNEAFPTDALAPFANPQLEEAMLQRGAEQFVVIGAGARLLPTAIGMSDAVLQNVETRNTPLGDKFTNQMRREIVHQLVSYFPFGPAFTPWCEFFTSWWKGENTLQTALFAYLKSLDFVLEPAIADGLNKLSSSSEFAIAPYWVPIA